MQNHSNKIKIINKYFDKNLSLQIQVYNLLTVIGMISGISVAVISLAIKESATTAFINSMLSVFSFIMLRAAEKNNRYNLCSWIMIIVIFMIAFPVLFFYCGGYKSGASCFFILAIIFTAFLLEKPGRSVFIAAEFVLYIVCCFVAYYIPGIAAVLPSAFNYFINVTLNFIVSGVLLLLAVMFRSRMIIIKQTQIQELNRELKARNETLEQYDKMKSDFLATVAHEINTPLAVIAASSGDTVDLLKESPLSINEIKKNQLVIEKKVKLIDNIIVDLMDTAAIETGRLSLRRQMVNLSELLENTCKAQYTQLDSNNNRVVYDFQPVTPQIWLDPFRIEQVIINLLSNAFRHTKNGIVTIKLIQGDDGSQIVSVIDNGEGMDTEMIRGALKQYVSNNMRTDYWRHGIGLYICWRIVAAHGGDIWIESEKGRGTAVSFSLFSLKEELTDDG